MQRRRWVRAALKGAVVGVSGSLLCHLLFQLAVIVVEHGHGRAPTAPQPGDALFWVHVVLGTSLAAGVAGAGLGWVASVLRRYRTTVLLGGTVLSAPLSYALFAVANGADPGSALMLGAIYSALLWMLILPVAGLCACALERWVQPG